MKTIYKTIAIILMLSIIGCSSVPHNKALIYGKTLNAKENKNDNNTNIKSNTNHKTKEINRIVKNSENNTLEECEADRKKDLDTVLKILKDASIAPLVKNEDKYAVRYENDQFSIKQTNCSKNKEDLYVYELVIDSKTKAAQSLMLTIGQGLVIVALSPVLLVVGAFGLVIMGLVNGVLYLEKVANEK